MPSPTAKKSTESLHELGFSANQNEHLTPRMRSILKSPNMKMDSSFGLGLGVGLGLGLEEEKEKPEQKAEEKASEAVQEGVQEDAEDENAEDSISDTKFAKKKFGTDIKAAARRARVNLRQDIQGSNVEEMTHEDMISKIKCCQRWDIDLRTSWIHFTNAEANGVRDPTRHEIEFLRRFFRGVQDGSMEEYRCMRNPHRGENANEVFIGGVGKISVSDIEAYFKDFGELRYVDVKRDKGFGFVKFNTREGLEAVLAKDEHVVEGKKIEVKGAENRTPKKREIGKDVRKFPPYDESRGRSRWSGEEFGEPRWNSRPSAPGFLTGWNLNDVYENPEESYASYENGSYAYASYGGAAYGGSYPPMITTQVPGYHMVSVPMWHDPNIMQQYNDYVFQPSSVLMAPQHYMNVGNQYYEAGEDRPLQ